MAQAEKKQQISCPKCGHVRVIYRTSRTLHFICTYCGNEFNKESEKIE
jgi:DNA-directed RNA polymerase subunit RPC12/RpoP